MSTPRPVRPVLFGLLLGSVLAPVGLGISTAAIALPAVSKDLGLAPPQAAWVLIGYALTQAVSIPLSGRIADKKGLRTVMLAGAALLTAGSFGAVLGPSFTLVLVGRLVQGAGAGALMVSAFGVVGARVAPGRRSEVLGVVGAVVGLVSGSGTWIGGLLADLVSWRLVFALPALSLLPLLAAVRYAPARRATGGKVDFFGAGLVATAAAIAVVLLESPSTLPSAMVLITLGAVGLLDVVMLRSWIRVRPDGFIPRVLVEDRSFVLACAAGSTVCAGYVSVLFAAPVLIAEAHGWSASQIGAVLLPAAISGALSASVVGRLAMTHDPFRIAAVLALASMAGVVLVAAGAGAIAPSVLGLGLVLAAQTGTNVVLVSRVALMVRPDARNIAVGVFSLFFQLGGPLGTAIVAGLERPVGLTTSLAVVGVLSAIGCGLVVMSGARAREATADALAG